MLKNFEYEFEGLEIDAAQDENGQIWISTPVIEKLLAIRPSSIRHIVDSRPFKDYLGESFNLKTIKDKHTKNNTNYRFYSSKTFLMLITFLAIKGNQNAILILANKSPLIRQKDYIVKQAKKTRKGLIYLVELDGCLKVGFSTNLNQRLKTFKTCNSKVNLIAKKEGLMADEQEIFNNLKPDLGIELYSFCSRDELMKYFP